MAQVRGSVKQPVQRTRWFKQLPLEPTLARSRAPTGRVVCGGGSQKRKGRLASARAFSWSFVTI